MMTMTKPIATGLSLILALLTTSAHAVSGLRVKCNMEGATVLLDWQEEGACPANLTPDAGPHTLVVKKPIDVDYEYYYNTELNLKDGKIKTVEAALTKVYTDEGWYKRGNDDEYLKSFPNGKYAEAIQEKRRWKKDRVSAILQGKLIVDCSDCPEMMVIPAGSFQMGSPATEVKRSNDESPLHSVNVRRFALGKTEVTFAQWDACVTDGGCNGYRPKDEGWGRGERPVIYVSWDDAQAYVQWLSRKTGKTYRLPSEAEWEYAARAGSKTPFNNNCNHEYNPPLTTSLSNPLLSASLLCEVVDGWCIHTDEANYNGDYVYSRCLLATTGVYRHQTLPVGSFAANAFGLLDMRGNVWEWVEDCYHDSYSGAPSDGSAWVSGECKSRVLRGGSWVSYPWGLRAAIRGRNLFTNRNSDLGFRAARTLP